MNASTNNSSVGRTDRFRTGSPSFKTIFFKRLIIGWIIAILFCAIALNYFSKAYKQYCVEYARSTALIVGRSLQVRISNEYPEGIPGKPDHVKDEEEDWSYSWVFENEEAEKEYYEFKSSLEAFVPSAITRGYFLSDPFNWQRRGVFSPPVIVLQVCGIDEFDNPLRGLVFDEECFNEKKHFNSLIISQIKKSEVLNLNYTSWIDPNAQYDVKHEEGVYLVQNGIRVDNKFQRPEMILRIAVCTSLFRAYPLQVILSILLTLLFALVISLISSVLTYRERVKFAAFQSLMDRCLDRGIDLIEERLPGKQETKRAELKGICLKVLQELEPSFHKANLDSHFSTDQSPVIGVDALLVKTAFKEILWHMIEYSDQGSTIKISLNEKEIMFEKNITQEDYEKGLVLPSNPGLYNYEMAPDLLLAKRALERIGMDFSCGNLEAVLKIRCCFGNLIVKTENAEDVEHYSSQVDQYSGIVEQSNRILWKDEEG